MSEPPLARFEIGSAPAAGRENQNKEHAISWQRQAGLRVLIVWIGTVLSGPRETLCALMIRRRRQLDVRQSERTTVAA